jgi:sugar (pentulose or hexulose) kinase
VDCVLVLTHIHLIVGKDTRILATGGASNNLAILQVLADVFNSSVYTLVSVDTEFLSIFKHLYQSGGKGTYPMAENWKCFLFN